MAVSGCKNVHNLACRPLNLFLGEEMEINSGALGVYFIFHFSVKVDLTRIATSYLKEPEIENK